MAGCKKGHLDKKIDTLTRRRPFGGARLAIRRAFRDIRLLAVTTSTTPYHHSYGVDSTTRRFASIAS